LAKLAKNVAAEASNFLMGRTFLDIDMARAADLLGMERRQAEMFRDLARGHFVALGPALSRRPLPVVIGAVETSARSTSPKLTPLPQAPTDAKELIFARDPEAERVVRPRPAPRPVPAPMPDLLAQLSRPPAPRPTEPEMDEAERNSLIDAALTEMLADPDASFRSVAVLYQDFLVRCRIRRVPGEPMALPAFKRKLAVLRAGVADELKETDAWQTALELSHSLDEDVQGVFLLLAQASLSGAPCPSDASIARAYGTHSTGRARRLLAWFEERGLLVIRLDGRKHRILAFPDLGSETAPGDPAGPDEAVAREAAE
jgi:hypothetical protein